MVETNGSLHSYPPELLTSDPPKDVSWEFSLPLMLVGGYHRDSFGLELMLCTEI